MNLKLICYKSGLLFVIFITTAAMLILFANSISYHVKDSRPFAFLGDEYVTIHTTYVDYENNYTLVKSIKDTSEDSFAAESYESHGGCAVWFDDGYDAEIEMTDGRFFCGEDFENHDNVAVVNNNSDNVIKQIGSDKILVIDDMEFTVIGEFSAPGSNYGNDWYVSLASDNLRNETVTGKLYFDSREDTVMYAEKICKDISSRNPDSNVVFELNRGPLGSMIDDAAYRTILLIFGILIALVFANTFAVSRTWIKSRRMEISVRCMCGAQWEQAFRQIAFEYYLIMAISFVLGIIVDIAFLSISDYLPIKETVEIMFGGKIYPSGIGAGAILVFLTGILPLLQVPGLSSGDKIVEGLH